MSNKKEKKESRHERTRKRQQVINIGIIINCKIFTSHYFLVIVFSTSQTSHLKCYSIRSQKKKSRIESQSKAKGPLEYSYTSKLLLLLLLNNRIIIKTSKAHSSS